MTSVVIGSGAAGLASALLLSKAKILVDVFEASNCVGGLARTLSLWGKQVDVGPHSFFSRDRRVNQLWLEVVGRDYAMVQRLTRILYRGKFFQYPLQPLDALVKLGPVESARCVASYARQRLWTMRSGVGSTGNLPVPSGNLPDGTGRGVERGEAVSLQPDATLVSSGKLPDEAGKLPAPPGAGDSFEHWVCSRFGRRLFEIFFKTYSEKLWGIPCDELDADFAAQRIKQFSLAAALKSAFTGNGSKHRTLVDEFAYPTGGTGMVYERMAERIRNNGGRIFLNTPVQRVLTEGGRVVGIEVCRASSSSPRPSPPLGGGEGETVIVPCDHMISTMPLTLLVERLVEAPAHVLEAAGQLTFRNTIIVYLEVADSDVCPDQWIYIHSPELRTGRITNFRNWVPQLYGDSPNTILAMEYWCDESEVGSQKTEGGNRSEPTHVGSYDHDENLWRWRDEDLIALARRELVGTTLVKDESLILNGKVLRIPRCYPVYRRGYKELLRPIREYLSGIEGLQVIGRYGSFKYNNQDHSILMGILAAENILKNAGHDLWSVNADYDTYQEGCRITETGLVPA